MQKGARVSYLILGAVVVLAIAFWVGNSLYLFEGFPKGVDAYAHMTRIAWILEYFPQINWNPFWDSGTPFWIWTYPPLTALLSSGLIEVFGITVEQGMVWSGAALMLIGVLGLYFATFMISTSVPIAIFTSVLTTTTPAFWSWWGHGGNYARIWGMAFYFWSFAFLVWYLKRPSKIRFFLLALFASFAFGSHLLYGGLTVLTFGAYLLFAVSGWRKKILEGIKILGSAFLLSAYSYFPLLLTSQPGGRFIESAFGKAVTFRGLFFLDRERIFFTLPTRFTVIVFSTVILALVLLHKRRLQNRVVRAVVLGLGLGVLASLFYILIGNIPGYPEKGYLAVFPPFATLPPLVFFSAYFLSGVLSGLSPRISTALGLSLTALIIVLFALNLPFEKEAIFDVSQPGNPQVVAQEMIATIPLSPDFRFGTDSAFVADWFNYLYPDQPQTRDYIYQGIPFKQWQYFLEWLVWTQPDRLEETQFLLDWYGVNYFTVGLASANTQLDKFTDHPELFKEEARSDNEDFYVFSYQDPTPIASFSQAPTILMIGERKEFETLVRTLAIANLGTRRIIPVYGGRSLSLPLSELGKFDAVFLYDYQTKNLDSGMKPLAEFVHQGGALLIESNRKIEAEQTLEELPDPFPIRGINLETRKNDWGFEPSQDFSPALFGTDPWKVNTAKEIKPWAEVILSSSSKPVIVAGDFGRGRVVWSGFNLPYHALSYQSKTEGDYFGGLLETILRSSLEEKREEKVNFSLWQPERRVIELSVPRKGVLLKESHFPQWHAYLKTTEDKQLTTKKLRIFTAGPNLMYIPLPPNVNLPARIILDYQISLIEKLGWLTTFAAFVTLSLYLAGRSPKICGKIDLKSWWDEE